MNTTKKTMMAVIMGLLATPVIASEATDTLEIEEVSKVKIETRDTVQRIVISGAKDDPTFHYVQRISIPDTSAVRRTIKSVRDFNKISIKKDGKKTKWNSAFHLNVGLNTMTGAPDGYDFKLWPSFDIGVGETFDWHPYGKKNEWSIGWGLDWRTFRLKKDKYWEQDNVEPKKMELVDYTLNDGNKTSLYVFSLQVPVLYTHYFDNKYKWGVTLGGIVNFNVTPRAKYQFKSGNETYDVSIKHIGNRPVTVDLMAQLHTAWLPSLYFKYCPMTFFKDNRGEKMHQLSFGICM